MKQWEESFEFLPVKNILRHCYTTLRLMMLEGMLF